MRFPWSKKQTPAAAAVPPAVAVYDPMAVANYRNAAGDLDFVESQVPWIDRPKPDIDGTMRSLKTDPGYDLRGQLEHWHKYGYVVFEKAANTRLIDILLGEVEEICANNSRYDIMVAHETRGRVPIKELTREDLRHPHFRITDFHNASVAGKKLALNPFAVSFLRHVFRENVVAMQTLAFRHGSEQGAHQDYAYVVSGNPSHLAASWLALEDAHPDAGPLGFFPGSHRIRKFDFGDGLFLTGNSKYREDDFKAHILKECARMGLEQKIFLPKKGDVFMWHAALCHEGTPAKNRNLTRLSLVTHFSSVTAYPRDRRNLNVEPKTYSYNGGIVYGDPLHPHAEDIFRAGAAA